MTPDDEMELALAEAEAEAAELERARAPAQAAPVQSSPQEPSTGTAAVLGGLRGASAGLLDELYGAQQAARGALMSAGIGFAQTPLGRSLVGDRAADEALPALARGFGLEQRGGLVDTLAATYRRARDEQRAREKEAFTAHPAIGTVGEIGGALAVPIPTPAKAAAIGRTGLALSKHGARALSGAIQGGAYGLGTSEADLTEGDVGGLASDVATGAATGAGLGVGLGALGERASQALRGWSEANALRAMGLRAGITDRLRKMGFSSAERAQREIGKRALDEGLIGIGSTPASILRDVTDLLPLVGASKGQVIQDAQAAATAAGRTADFGAAADAALKASLEGADTIAAAKGGQARRLAELVRKQGETATVDDSLVFLDKLKQSAQDSLRPMAPQLAQQQVNQVARALREETERQVEEIAGPQFADELRAMNSKYRFLEQVKELSSRASTQDLGNKGALGMVLGATVGSGAGPLGGMGAAAAGQFSQRHIAPGLPATKAVLERAASKLIPQVTPALSRAATTEAVGGATDPVGEALRWMRERYGEQPRSRSELGASAYVRGQGGQ